MQFVWRVGVAKALIALGLLGLVPRLGYDTDAARAVVFHFMAIGQLMLTYPSRHTAAFPLPNRYLLAAVLGGVVIQVSAAVWPMTARLLGDASLPWELWGMVALSAGLSWSVAEILARRVWRPTSAGPVRNMPQ
jgi:Ca2+-transporting ATPase